ncbi:MAG: Mut7-C RNAse domain-containing protein [Anaerolineae bacterium]
MLTARFRFYAELNDFLPPEQRQRPVTYRFEVAPSVKDAIESLGVPHPEIDLILANGESVDFAYILRPDDFISVYPVFEAFDIGPLVKVRAEPLRETRFVLDVHLGRLAGYLRMLGFDTLYRNNFDDAELARISSEQHRILLTRDRGLLKRSIVTHGYCLRATQPREQLAEVVARFDLAARARPFWRCIRCNGLLEPVDKAALAAQLKPETLAAFDEFSRCRECGQVYWPGTHYERMRQFIEQVAPGVKLAT